MRTCCGFDYLGVDELGAELDDVRAGRGILKRGSKGAAVSEVQRLVGLSGADADGDFGSKTYEAVKAFQKARGLPADGVVGRDTAAALSGDASRVDFSEGDVVTARAPAKTARASLAKGSAAPAGEPQPKVLSETLEEGRSPVVTYGAIGLGALAVGGLAYALLGR